MTGLIAQQIAQIRQEIPDSVRLIAVTKQVSVAAMREAYAAGIRDFGENRLQDALPKQEQLQDLKDLCWHFIGHLQTNKAKKVLEQFQWIHSVDSLKLAQHLDQIASELSIQPQVCLQVKMLSDPQKYGWTPCQLWTDLPLLNQCQSLKIQGLMTILPLGLSDTEILATFRLTRDLADKITENSQLNLLIKQISMGMSSDYQFAVAAGATMIRIGSLIFGQRKI
jgi:PLP dependent protein